MQRQLKFRGYAELVGHPAGLVYGSGCYIDEGNRHHVISDDTGKPDFLRVREINSWTGLKDKNGKEIYEGDIVRTTKLGFRGLKQLNSSLRTVEWDEENCGWKLVNSQHSNLLKSIQVIVNALEIIGNIYENPELIKP